MADAKQVGKGLEEGYALPSRWYSDADVLELERRRIFSRSWLYFGPEAQVATPGSYVARTTGGLPIVVTRDAEGVLHGFLNVCRHRLHPVAEGCGKAKLLQCPYHAWSYALDGRLTGAPRSGESLAEDGVEFSKADFGLIRVAVEAWGPMLFVNAERGAPPLQDVMGDVATLMAERGVNFDTSAAWYGERVVACNWKTAIDNVIECYHCPTVHPEFSAHFDTRAQALEVSVLGQACSMAAPQRKTAGENGGEEGGGDYHAYFAPPNFYLSARGTHWFFASSYDPISTTQSLWRTEFYVPEGTTEATVQEILAGSDTVFNEDIAVAEKVQLAHDLKEIPSGYLMPHSEGPLRNFASFVYEAVTNGDAG